MDSRPLSPAARPLSLTLSAFLVLLALPRPAAGQPEPLGTNFQVNLATASGQLAPAVAHEPGAGFVVAWETAAETDGDGRSIRRLQVDTAGQPVGSELQVNLLTAGNQTGAEVVGGADGGFLVAWNGRDVGSSAGVKARIFGPQGDDPTSELEVNGSEAGTQYRPAAAALPDGGFMVVWESQGSGGLGDEEGRAVLGRRYGSDGSPGEEFLVNTFTTESQRSPRIASDASGATVVAWTSGALTGGDGSLQGIRARRFDPDGLPIGDDFAVNTETIGAQLRPDVAASADGAFLVVWESDTFPGDHQSTKAVVARWFGTDGSAAGDDLLVNAYTTGLQFAPRVALGPDGSAFVAWQGQGATDTLGIAARALAPGAGPLGPELVVHGATTGAQRYPTVGAAADGTFLVVWQSDVSVGDDTSDQSVQGQFYHLDLLLVDGFETGDTSRWSDPP